MMLTFEDWYKVKNPDLDPDKDDFYKELKEAYEAGWNACAWTRCDMTYEEYLEYERSSI